MIDFSKNCIYCNALDNLDTAMDVKVGDQKYKVSVCRTHEDQASPATAREHIQKKLDELKKLQEVAAQLGFTLTPQQLSTPGAGLVVPAAAPGIPQSQAAPQQYHQPAPPPAPVDIAALPKVEVAPGVAMAVQQDKRTQQQTQDRLVNLLEGRNRVNPTVITDPNAIPHDPTIIRPNEGEAAHYESLRLPDTIAIRDETGTVRNVAAPKITAKEMGVVQGRGGSLVAIPTKVESAAGRTTIAVVDTGGDQALQRRAKMEAQMANADSGVGQTPANLQAKYKGGCTACNGSGVARIGSGACPKCAGSGLRL